MKRRRSAAGFLACVLLALAVPLFAGAPAPSAAVETKETQAAMTPSSALQRLKDGNARFLSGRMKRRDFRGQVKAVAGGQYPFAALVSCMDARVPPEIVFDQGLGDVFAIRLAGNVVDDDVLGSLEYAAKVVGVRLIVVLGHSSCGAAKGAIDDVRLGNLTGLLARLRPAVAAAAAEGGVKTSKDHDFVEKVVEANVRQGLKEIREKSPVLKELLEKGTVGLAGAVYELETGKVVFHAD